MENTKTTLAKLAKIKINKTNFRQLPTNPGMYIFFSGKKIIYIGKANNLKLRLLSYLSLDLGPKTKKMINTATDASYIKVTSELEALLLEAKLINKFKPHYNIIAKDDKHPLYIVITKEDFPRILSVRSQFTVNSSLLASFGPFPSSKNVKTILRLIRRVIPFSDHKLGKKPCLYSQIGLCSPCPNNIVQSTQYKVLKKTYLKNIRNIKRLLEGKFSVVEKNLVKLMKNYSKNKDYENAAVLRDKLKVLEYITQPKIPIVEFLQNPNLVEDIRKKELEALKALLFQFSTPNSHITQLRRVECYDISHLAGVKATASIVVAIKGELEKSEYRHFKIKQKKTQSDFDSMKEVAERRIGHIDGWGKPDLIIVDGGLAQVKAFNQVFEKIKVPVVGIAKHPDRLIFVSGKKVRLEGSVLNFVSRIRNEAHRFARRYHHLLMKKNLLY